MKHYRFLTRIVALVGVIVLGLFMRNSFTEQVFADQTCRVLNAEFIPNSAGAQILNDPPQEVTVRATTSSCLNGQNITITVGVYKKISNPSVPGGISWQLETSNWKPTAQTKIVNNTAEAIFKTKGDSPFTNYRDQGTYHLGLLITTAAQGVIEGTTYQSTFDTAKNDYLAFRCSTTCRAATWENITPIITPPDPTNKFFYNIHPQSEQWTQGGGAQGQNSTGMSQMFDTFADCEVARKAHLIRQNQTQITLGTSDEVKYGTCKTFNTGTGTIGNISLSEVNKNDPCYNDASGIIDPTCYPFIEPLPGLTAIRSSDGLGKYVNTLFQIAIGLLGILAVTMITVAGFTYMTTDSASAKEDAKKRIGGAIFGLILALGIFILLGTINPNLLKVVPEIPKVNLTFDTKNYDGDAVTTTQFTLPQNLGLYCPKPATGDQAEIKKIVDSFVGKTTYRYGGKGGDLPANSVFPETKPEYKTCPSDTVCLDCSGFVNHIWNCAGFGQAGNGTAGIFGSNSQMVGSITENQNQVTVNGNYVLQPGDLVGFPATSTKPGHVWIYVGEGLFAESNGSGRTKGDGVKTGRNITNIKASAERAGFRLYLRKIQ